MKLKNIIPQRSAARVIQQFGRAKLVKHRNGQHELIGGTDDDRAEAFEWASLFAHEIVFTHFHREPTPAAGRGTSCPPPWKWWPVRPAPL